MKFVTDPPISVKIRQMKERVRWKHPQILQRNIDQTRLVLEDGKENPAFSFLVLGDSGSGRHRRHNPQRKIAEQMLLHQEECRFVLHTGDVVYLVGSSEYYHTNFINPYQEWIVGGEHPENIAYDKMTFKIPILPVPGNHDYYDLPIILGVLSQATFPFRRLLQSYIQFDIGFHGSYQGQAYAKAFLDYLKGVNDWDLGRHLDQHYTATTETGKCLSYQPGKFTRLPNRYYQFRSGGIDFFALDSNTFNDPLPLPPTQEGANYRKLLEKRLQELELQKQQISDSSNTLNPDSFDDAERLDDIEAKLEQIEEVQNDIEKQLASDRKTVIDFEQLNWLKQRLIESWNTSEVRGRIIYFHHPPYVTEATKWEQGQTLAIRRQIRWVLDEVATVLGEQTQGRPLVDLILNGHAHCLEYLQTCDSGHADSNLNWIVCGGSGYSLRRQRKEGSILTEYLIEDNKTCEVAESLMFAGRQGHGSHKRRPYSFLRIDVTDGMPPKFVVRPFICERYRHDWNYYEMESLIIG